MPSLKYNQPSFWEEKYKTNCCETYEWICKPEHIFTSAVSDHIKYDQMNKVLEIGCGTSTLGAKLKKEAEGRRKNFDLTCIDFSKEVIKKNRSLKSSGVTYLCADVRNMSELPAGSFDYIFDKGCFDCLFCCDGFMKEVLKGLRQCFKLLRGDGKLIILSHGKPKNRSYLFRNRLVPFNLQVEVLPKSKERPTEVYAYICTKPESGEEQQEEGKVIIQDDQSQKKSQHEEEKHEQPNQKPKEEPSDFILKEKKKKKEQGGDFILAEKQQQNEPGGDFILGSGADEGGQIKEDKQEESNFILKEAEYSNDFDEV